MFYVYAIKSLRRKYIYVGLSDNIERRLNQHNKGENKTTRPYLPFELILKEIFISRIEARKREKYWRVELEKSSYAHYKIMPEWRNW